MPVSADTLRLHLDYTGWANQRLLSQAAQLSDDDLTRDFKTSDKSVLNTLVHILAADRIWLARVHGNSPATFIHPEDRHLSALEKEWPLVHTGWKTWAGALTDQSAQAKIPYRDIKGNDWEQPVWQILLHVVNHGTHHRGQVSGFLRAMGHNPPPLDLIAFYRQL